MFSTKYVVKPYVLIIILLRINALQNSLSSLSYNRKVFISLSMNVNSLEEDAPAPKPKPVIDHPVVDTSLEKPNSQPKPLSPKIIVLGSTGRIGRLVIRKLMSIPFDITVIAFARDYERACEVLYDELIEENNKVNLQLKIMDLVPDQYVAGYTVTEEDDNEEYAVSAARFYQNDLNEYGIRSSKEDDEQDLNPYLQLQEAMKNATAIISTVGTVRSTVPFADYILKPWRIFISPEKWCKDKKHPYYVNYMFHKKLIQYAEDEQVRRNQLWRSWESSKGVDESVDDDTYLKNVDKLRIIRISDLCLAAPAWYIVTVITNIFRSLVFKYQEQCEKLLFSSNLVDVIILRPGDLVDQVRNETTTSLRIGIDGTLPLPTEVGREDVASLSCLAALSDLDVNNTKRGTLHQSFSKKSDSHDTNFRLKRSKRLRELRKNQLSSKKWLVGVGWTQEKGVGYDTVERSMEAIIKKEAQRTTRERRKLAVKNTSLIFRILLIPIQNKLNKFKQKKIKPYGIFVLLPMILFVYPVIGSILKSMISTIPVLHRATVWALTTTLPWRKHIRSHIFGANNNIFDQIS